MTILRGGLPFPRWLLPAAALALSAGSCDERARFGNGGSGGEAGSGAGGSSGSGGTGDGGSGGSGGTGGAGGNGGGPGADCGWILDLPGASRNASARAALALADSSVIVAASGGELLRLGVRGEIAWRKTLEGIDLAALAPASGGNVLATGSSEGSAGCANHTAKLDAWIGLIDPADGTVLFSTCVGGNGDDEGRAIREVEAGGFAVYQIVGTSNSSSAGSGNVGKGRGADDLLYGVHSTDPALAAVHPRGFLFGTRGPESGVGFTGDLLVGLSFGDDSGDLVGLPFSFIDVFTVSPPTAPCLESCSPAMSATRFGGEANEQVAGILESGIFAGSTRSRSGSVACPRPEDDQGQSLVGLIDSAGNVDGVTCFGGRIDEDVRGVAGNDEVLVVVGNGGYDGDFEGSFPLGGIGGAFVASFDRVGDELRWTATGGPNESSLSGVTLRPDGCVVAVGRAEANIWVVTLPPDGPGR